MGTCASSCGGKEPDSNSDRGKVHDLGHNIRNFTNTMKVTEPALADKYRGVKKLGGGSAGDIWLCHDLTAGQPDVALKLFPRPFQAGSRDVLLHEIQVAEPSLLALSEMQELSGRSVLSDTDELRSELLPCIIYDVIRVII